MSLSQSESTILHERIIYILMWNHTSFWGPMFGKQTFAGSWGRYFVGKLCDVTRVDNSYMIYLQTTERVIFLIVY